MRSDIIRVWSRPGGWIRILGLTAVYGLSGALGISFASFPGSQVTLIWLPSGICLAALLIWGARFWPGVFLGSFILAMVLGYEVGAGLALSTGNSLQALFGVWLLRRTDFRLELDRQRDIGFLALWGVTVSPSVSSTIDVTYLVASGLVPWEFYLPTLSTWWLGDAAGILLVTPLVLSWTRPGILGRRSSGRVLEAALISCLILLSSYIAFLAPLASGRFPLAFLPFPFLIWAALRFGVRGGATSAFVVSMFAILVTATNQGPFAAERVQDSVFLLWSFITSTSALSLLLGAVWAEHQRGQVALTTSEERFRGAFEDAPIGIALIGFEGQLQQINRRFCEMTGYSGEELLSRTFFDITHPHELKDNMRLFLEVLETQGKVQPFQTRYIRKGGESIWVQVSSTPLNDASSHLPVALIAHVEDITEKKAAEDERLVLQHQLLQAQKMESLGQMVGGVAHDFNNLMLAVLGFADLMLDSEDLPPSLREYAKQVRRAGQRASDLTRKLLTFSRNQVMQPEVINLNDLLAGLVTILHRLIPESIQLDWHPDPHLEQVEADPGQIEQVMINLCVNARDAMQAGGLLEVATHQVEADGELLKKWSQLGEGSWVMLSVKDTGCGISEELLERIFDPFFTTKEPGEGTGLGLAMVYGIIRKHGGFIDVESVEDIGTTFKVYLPATPESAAVQTGSEELPLAAGSETILIAEDEEAVRTLARKVLEGAGYSVLAAENGEEALELFEQCRQDIDLVLLDVVMPRLGGRETYERLRRLDQDLPILFTSGYTGAALPSEFLEKEGLTLIAKPYKANVLLQTLRQVLDEVSVPRAN